MISVWGLEIGPVFIGYRRIHLGECGSVIRMGVFFPSTEALTLRIGRIVRRFEAGLTVLNIGVVFEVEL